LEFWGECDLLGYNNLKFDVALLNEELKRAGESPFRGGRRIYDAFKMFKSLHGRSLSAALDTYNIHADPRDAHTALGDAGNTLALVLRMGSTPFPDPEYEISFCLERMHRRTMIGKHNGIAVDQSSHIVSGRNCDECAKLFEFGLV